MHRFLSIILLSLVLCLPHASAAAEGRPLLIGVPPNAAPLSFLNEDRTGVMGLAVDLSIKIAEMMDREILFIQSNARKLEQRLKRGEIDAIIGLLPVDLKNDFSDVLVTPLALNRGILVAGPEHPFIEENDLSGHRVLLVRGDLYEEKLQRMGCDIVVADSISNALNRLVAGEAEAYVASSVEMAFHVVQRRGYKDIHMLGGSLERIPMVMMVGRHSHMLEKFTGALGQLEEEGEVEKLRAHWLGRPLSAPSLWALYARPLMFVALFIAAGFIVVSAWIYILRSQVRKVSHRLLKSERKYRKFIEESPDIILLLDEYGRINLSNRAARSLLNVEEGQGSPMLMEALCSEAGGCIDQFVQLIPPNGSIQRELVLNPGTEEELILEANLFMADMEDSLYSVCLIGRDVTQRRRLDRQVMEMERLAVLGKMAAGVAHEINNPIGIIMANAELAMEDCEEGSAMQAMLRAIYRNGERAVSTTRRLMNIALPESVQYARQDLAQAVQDSLFFLKPRLRQVTVDTSLLPSGLWMRGNHILLEQLLLNLFINALDSMEQAGWRVLRVEGRCAGGQVMLDISDSGHGISPDKLEKLFEPFFSTKGGKGFGLGLYISRHIAEQHEGQISAWSDGSSGATLSLAFKAWGQE